MNMAQRNTTIDALKLLFSLAVIGIHIKVFQSVPILYNCITQGLFRIGVPFFFVASGYYLALKVNDRTAFRKYWMRLLSIYAGFELLDLIIIVPFRCPSPVWILQRVVTCGVNGIYWYLISLILTCVLCRPLWAKKKTFLLLAAGVALYLLAMTDDSYSMVFAGTRLQSLVHMHTEFWCWPQAGLAESVLFLSVGVYLRQNEFHVQRSGLLCSVSLILLMVEAWMTQSNGASDANCYLSLILTVPLLFLWAVDHPHKIRFPQGCGEISLYVYMTHIYFTYIPVPVPGVLRFLIAAAVSLIISAGILKLRNRLKRRDA